MKKTNRTIAALLAAVMMLSVSACGNSEKDNDNDVEVRTPSSSTASSIASSTMSEEPAATTAAQTEEATTTTQADTEESGTSSAASSSADGASDTVDPSVYAGITPYEAKNEEEQEVMDTFGKAITAIRDNNVEDIIRYTAARDELSDVYGASLGSLMKFAVEKYNKHAEELDLTLDYLCVANDGSYVITNVEPIPDNGIEYAGEDADIRANEYFDKYGFTMIQFHSLYYVSNPAVDKGYLVTFKSFAKGEMQEVKLAVIHIPDEFNETHDVGDTGRTWFLDQCMYHDCLRVQANRANRQQEE